MVLALIPVFCVILGLTVLRRAPARLFALGYVIEGPLMLLLAVRFFLIRQATPGVSITLLVALLGMAAFLWTLLDILSGERRLPYESLRLLGLTLMALTSLYAAVWIAFYALPAGAELLPRHFQVYHGSAAHPRQCLARYHLHIEIYANYAAFQHPGILCF